jgi:hypothetical protein
MTYCNVKWYRVKKNFSAQFGLFSLQKKTSKQLGPTPLITKFGLMPL